MTFDSTLDSARREERSNRPVSFCKSEDWGETYTFFCKFGISYQLVLARSSSFYYVVMFLHVIYGEVRL